MPAPPEPLVALATVREHEVVLRARALHEARACREAAEEERSQLATVLQGREQGLVAAMTEARVRLDSGGLRASELGQVEAFRAGEEAALEAGRSQLAALDRRIVAARHAEDAAQVELGRARAEEEVLGRHLRRVADAARRTLEGQAEEAQAESHGASRPAGQRRGAGP